MIIISRKKTLVALTMSFLFFTMFGAVKLQADTITDILEFIERELSRLQRLEFTVGDNPVIIEFVSEPQKAGSCVGGGIVQPAAKNKQSHKPFDKNFEKQLRELGLYPHFQEPARVPAHQGQTTAPQQQSNKSSKVMFKDIVGLEPVLNDIKEVVNFIKKPEKFKALGAQLPKGILLEGPPGNGKTLIAKAIANEAGCEFVYASASSFVEQYVGVGAKRIRELFEQARRNKPAIIFIDELDAIGAVSRGAGGNEEYRQTLNELLCQLDGFEGEDSIVVIGATNFARALDKALTRSGRFDRLIKVPQPDEQGRESILSLYINKLPSKKISPTYIHQLAQETSGLCGADLKNLVNEAALAAVRENSVHVEEKHLEAATKKVMGQRRP